MAARASFIDLSHILESGMPVFPGSRPVILETESTLEKDTYNETSLRFTTHTGTHIDCGLHMIPGSGDTLSTPLDSFYGTGQLIHCRHLASNPVITRKYLESYEKQLSTTDYLLFYTGWDQYWGSAQYYNGFPVMDTGAAEYISGFSLKGIGVDAISFDVIESTDFPVHRLLLSVKMILVENLHNLAGLPASGFTFAGFPLPIKHGDGSPVRAVGIVINHDL
jgi:kynurenine formamidase